MSALRSIPEVVAFDSAAATLRIPEELDIPLTPRVRQLIDTPEFARLRGISQLGLVSLVYPAANHTRFEHSLGVYRLALLYLKRLANDERFEATVRPEDAELFLVAALLHDLGHWPFCHPLEDMQLPSVPKHELFANSFLLEGEVADVLRDEWGINPRDIVSLLSEKPRTASRKILSSMLSGPIDVDKMDYLYRDSLHAGVPYGRQFDQGRLISSLCLNKQGTGLAISEKGRTAAEMMVFARYVMFSEVYWHHCVRSATAMLQRAFYSLHGGINLDHLFRQAETPLIESLRQTAEGTAAEDLLEGLFGATRGIYKRLAQYSLFQEPKIYERLARRSYPWLVACSESLASGVSQRLGQRVAPHEILIDAPPMGLEVQFNIEVFFPKEDLYRPLAEVSPVVRTLALEQFDDYVKRVRVFAHPRIADALRQLDEFGDVLLEAIDQTDDGKTTG